MFWTKGKNHFSFGVQLPAQLRSCSDGVNNANGQFNIHRKQYTKDALGRTSWIGQIQSLYQGNNSGVDFRKNYAGLYFQDSIQFTPAVYDERRSALGHRAAGD